MIHDPHLRQIVREVVDGPRANPGPRADTATALQIRIAQARLSGRVSEDDLIEAARSVGVPDDEFADWMEELASWL